MTKTTTPKAATPAPKAAAPAPGPDRAATLKVIARRIRLIGSRRAPATRALYNEAAAILEQEVRKHGKTPKN